MSSKLFHQPQCITRTFCMENGKHLTPRGLEACQRDPIMKSAMEKQTLSSPYVIILPLLLDPSEYNLVQRPVPLHQYAQRLMMPESGITPTAVSSACCQICACALP